MDFGGAGGYALGMAIDPHDKERLIRILRLLSSDHIGERASAALAANRLREALGVSWEELLDPPVPERVVVRKVRDWDVDQADAAEARIRQLKDTVQRQERQLRALRTRINSLTDRERKRREGEDLEL
ncbi:MAG: hypothetical protein EON57_19875 [Alphaproteobacteria bacterium]|nr:MAG: hypothetical protein EON57_19875 [Alphaproteobacteria bacterium]